MASKEPELGTFEKECKEVVDNPSELKGTWRHGLKSHLEKKRQQKQ